MTHVERPICDSDTLRRQILDGDPHALDDLFRCSQQALTRYLRSRCGDVQDAEDALQVAFENAHRCRCHETAGATSRPAGEGLSGLWRNLWS
jgi:DNA-directed RNA polymerase specialized sigma24 family protein